MTPSHRPRVLRRLRQAGHALWVALGLAAPATQAATPTPSPLPPPSAATSVPPIERLADIRARLLAQDELLAATNGPDEGESVGPDGPMAQWFNWPNWTNWGKWNNWDNWNNWVKWSKF